MSAIRPRLANEILRTQADYWPPHHAATFIGLYSRPPKQARSAKRVHAEIDVVRTGAARAMQFAELGNIARKHTVARVVARALRGASDCADAEH